MCADNHLGIWPYVYICIVIKLCWRHLFHITYLHAHTLTLGTVRVSGVKLFPRPSPKEKSKPFQKRWGGIEKQGAKRIKKAWIDPGPSCVKRGRNTATHLNSCRLGRLQKHLVDPSLVAHQPHQPPQTLFLDYSDSQPSTWLGTNVQAGVVR